MIDVFVGECRMSKHHHLPQLKTSQSWQRRRRRILKIFKNTSPPERLEVIIDFV
jgi:hypothetical protein